MKMLHFTGKNGHEYWFPVSKFVGMVFYGGGSTCVRIQEDITHVYEIQEFPGDILEQLEAKNDN